MTTSTGSAIDYGDTDTTADEGFQVQEEVAVGDLSEQQGGVMEAVAKVPFTIRKASVRTQEDKETSTWSVKRLVVEAAIGPLGVDGEGKFANKVLFPEFVLTFNSADFPEKFSSNWWQREARFPLKQFLKAIGRDITSVRVNDEFLIGLQNEEFVADIKRKEIQTKGEDGKWHGTGDFKNELANFRAANQSSE
jgi:hypothetical protein